MKLLFLVLFLALIPMQGWCEELLLKCTYTFHAGNSKPLNAYIKIDPENKKATDLNENPRRDGIVKVDEHLYTVDLPTFSSIRDKRFWILRYSGEFYSKETGGIIEEGVCEKIENKPLF